MGNLINIFESWAEAGTFIASEPSRAAPPPKAKPELDLDINLDDLEF